ncbi:MAG TPA: 16S rRNA (guanine(527)-N(7))-methyltransferase RsmG [Clostridiales bacterium]|nr:16S rRNA (guanine(527)-N(7))-methyltransferase RsmG [Clostridiales bacterium]
MEYNQYPEIHEFYAGLEELGISLTEKQIQQFIDYYELLVERNKVMNLTAITEFREVIIKHFIDSLSIVKFRPLTNERILDVGTGAGFPGIPLKIVYPDIELVLLDSLNKRLVFLKDVIEKLGLDKVQTLHGRAEDYGKDTKHREKYDLCLSRAVAKLSSLVEYCLPYVKKGGFFISYKSGIIAEELSFSKNALNILGGTLDQVKEFILPGTDIERSLVVIRKTSPTPKNYPRSAGKPSKEPL